MEVLEQAAQVLDPDAVVWRGDPCLGVVILGTPLGHADFCDQRSPPTRLSWEEYEQWATCKQFVLLLFCASARTNFLLRMQEFATQHDDSLHQCLSSLLGIDLPVCCCH